MKFKSKIQKNGLANIPVAVRKSLELKEGDNIEFVVMTYKKDTIIVVKKEGE